MGVSGRLAVGAHDQLAELFREQMLQAQHAEQQRQFDARQQQVSRELDQRGREHADQMELGNRRLQADIDAGAATRRQRANEQGVADMEAQKKIMDADAAEAGLSGVIAGMAEGPAKRVANLRRFGIQGIAPQDVETPEERGTREAGDLQRIRTIAEAQRGPSRGRRSIQQVVGPDGGVQFVSIDLDSGEALPVQLPPGTAPNKPPKPVTGAERQTLGFYQRMKEALDNLEGSDALEDAIAAQGAMGQAQGQYAPNMLQTDPQQRYRQAQRSYTEARLRKESGAAIPTAEYENDARTYFFQPGDTGDTLKQKRESRKVVLEGMRNASGRAYAEHYGDDGKPRVTPNASKTVTMQQLTALAQAKGTTVEEQAKRAAAEGYIIR